VNSILIYGALNFPSNAIGGLQNHAAVRCIRFPKGRKGKKKMGFGAYSPPECIQCGHSPVVTRTLLLLGNAERITRPIEVRMRSRFYY
jgi:hypothetical protein